MPALALVLVYFGYIARMARAGTITSARGRLHPHGHHEGASPRSWPILRKHVLRNALLPTISVIATQTGYLFGGLRRRSRLIFNVNGVGSA